MNLSFVLLACAVAILAALLPTKQAKHQWLAIVLVLSTVFASYAIAIYWQKTTRAEQIAEQAASLIQGQYKRYSHLGFVHAALALLEKNQDVYPDSYQRARRLCIAYQCESPFANFDKIDELARAMQGILTGLQ